MKKDNTEEKEDELRSEYDFKSLRVRRLGPSRQSFGAVVREADGAIFAFEAGNFYSDLAETPVGGRLWRFFNSKEALHCLEMTTACQRPALEGLQHQLLQKFGEALRGNKKKRWKRMIGRMVCQVMKHHGYTLDKKGVTIRPQILFTKATSYQKN